MNNIQGHPLCKVVLGLRLHKNEEPINKPNLHKNILIALQDNNKDHWSGAITLMKKDLLCLDTIVEQTTPKAKGLPPKSILSSSRGRAMIEVGNINAQEDLHPLLIYLLHWGLPMHQEVERFVVLGTHKGNACTLNVHGVKHRSSKKEKIMLLFSLMMVPMARSIKF